MIRELEYNYLSPVDYEEKCYDMKQDQAHKAKRKIRKGVETAFSVITAKFGKVIRATSIRGFLVKLKLFILAYSIDKFFMLSKSHQKLAFN